MKQIIKTHSAPKPVGTYSQAVKAGNTVYLSGQIALDPKSGELIGQGDFEKQLEQVFQNISAVVEAAGGALSQLARLTIYVTDIQDQPKVSDVMKKYFKEPYPARTVVAVKALPIEAIVEVESVLVLGE